MSSNNRREIEIHSFEHTIIKACQLALAQYLAPDKDLDLAPSSTNISMFSEQGFAFVRYNAYFLKVEFRTGKIRLLERVHIQDSQLNTLYTVNFILSADWNIFDLIGSYTKDFTFLIIRALCESVGIEEAHLAFLNILEIPNFTMDNDWLTLEYSFGMRNHLPQKVESVKIHLLLVSYLAIISRVEIKTKEKLFFYRVDLGYVLKEE